jgi:hypothetical protein
MALDKVRVLYSEGGCELMIEVDRLNERVVFVAPNKTGFSGQTLKDIEDNANSSMVAARQLLTVLDTLKEKVSERAPAMLGYDGYISKRESKQREDDLKVDKLLKDMKAYTKEEDAI